MNDPQSSGILGLPASVWITLILGVAGVYALSQKPFQDTRPPNVTVPLHHHAADDGQVIEARLWEDPLGAVAIARDGREAPDPVPFSLLKDRLEKGSGSKEKPPTLVLGVILTGEPYTDDIETRRRTRYAVLAGLYRSRFIPAHSNHIGYIVPEIALPGETPESCPARGKPAAEGKRTAEVKPQATVKSPATVKAPADGTSACDHNIAAFEWLKRDNAVTGRDTSSNVDPAAQQQVLVLWLDQGQFREQPIRRLSKLLKSVAGSPNFLVSAAIIGPASSDGLSAFFDEVDKFHGNESWTSDDGLRPLNVYSPRATASDQSIKKVEPDAEVNLAREIFDKTHGNVQLFRTVSDDYTVERAVFNELKRQGISDESEIALVAERDTLYARNMGGYFKGCRNPPRPDPSHPVTGPPNDLAHPACFTYLRGLDGVAPTDTRSANLDTEAPQRGKGADQSSVNGLPAGVSDEASGQSQLDYLRRLATTMAALRGPPHIRAVGVISGDVYDKLLVLQALHAALPAATYFTFDLDARLLEEKNLRWTRQLIVGSSLGLSLLPDLQGDIPPFRDSYQTTTFFATLLAVHRFATGTEIIDRGALQAGLQWTTTPRIFEIGRSQQFDLTPPQTDELCEIDSVCQTVSQGRENWLWSCPHSRMSLQGLLAGVVLAVLSLGAAALALGVRGVVGLSRTHVIPGLGAKRWSNEVGSVIAAVVVIALVVILWPLAVGHLTGNCKTVPTPLLSGANQGISSLVDVIAIVVVMLLVVRGQRKLNDNAECVGREFGFKVTRRKLIKWHRERRREALAERHKAAARTIEQVADPAKQTKPGELPEWLTWVWFPLTALPRRTGIDLVNGDVSEIEAIIAQYLYHGTASARFWRVAPVTVLLVFLVVIPLEEIPGVAHFGRTSDGISKLCLIAMQFLIFWAADALLLSRSFILALKRDRPAWPSTTDMIGLPPQQAAQWLDLRLIAARTRGVSGLVWYPSFVIGAMAVAALTIQFREFQFANNPVALVIGTLFVIGSAVALRRAAETLRLEIKRRFANDRLRAPASAQSQQLELLIDRVERLSEGAFAPYSEQPIVRAVLVPAATYGATLGLQHLHLGP